jgi:hypothetical protein
MLPKVRSDVVPALLRGLCRMYAYIRLSFDHTPRRSSLEARDQWIMPPSRSRRRTRKFVPRAVDASTRLAPLLQCPVRSAGVVATRGRAW